MEPKLFTGLIDARAKVTSGSKIIANPPKAEWKFRLGRCLQVALRETETDTERDTRMGAFGLLRDSGS